MTREQLRELLAAHEHETWAQWQAWLHGLGVIDVAGNLILPAEHVRRWERQIVTRYADLSETEKDSDRKEADKVMAVLEPLIEWE